MNSRIYIGISSNTLFRLHCNLRSHSIENTPEAVEFFSFIANVNYENMFTTPDFDKVPPSKWVEILHEIRRNIPAVTLRESDPYEAIVITERGLCLAMRNVFAVYNTYE